MLLKVLHYIKIIEKDTTDESTEKTSNSKEESITYFDKILLDNSENMVQA